MKISIIVTTKNEEKNLGNLLESIKNQTFSEYELIVVDNNSTDRTKYIANKYGAYVFNKGPERSAQRNFGAKNSKGEFLLFLDADMVLENEILNEMISFSISHSEVKCITMKEVPIGISIWSKAKKLELSFYTQKDDFDLAPRWFRREVFFEFHGFDEDQTGTEDWDLPDRVYSKYPLKHLTKRKVFHNEGDFGLIHILKKKFYYASKSHKYVKKSEGGMMNPKFIYFLRPQFYKYWRFWFLDLKVSLALIILLNLEWIFAAFGFIFGKFLKNK
jgi:glycosyltransferase involved in cell wall biosynthesis